MGPNVLHCAVVPMEGDKAFYTMVYQDKESGKAFAKKFQIGGVTRDKLYPLAKSPGSKVVYFEVSKTEQNRAYPAHCARRAAAMRGSVSSILTSATCRQQPLGQGHDGHQMAGEGSEARGSVVERRLRAGPVALDVDGSVLSGPWFMRRVLPLVLLFAAMNPLFAADTPRRSIRPADKGWPASWIAHPTASSNDYGVFHFRKSFDLPGKPASFVVHLSADNRYRFFVNGTPVCLGPGPRRSVPLALRDGRHRPYLKPGEERGRRGCLELRAGETVGAGEPAHGADRAG